MALTEPEMTAAKQARYHGLAWGSESEGLGPPAIIAEMRGAKFAPLPVRQQAFPGQVGCVDRCELPNGDCALYSAVRDWEAYLAGKQAQPSSRMCPACKRPL